MPRQIPTSPSSRPENRDLPPCGTPQPRSLRYFIVPKAEPLTTAADPQIVRAHALPTLVERLNFYRCAPGSTSRIVPILLVSLPLSSTTFFSPVPTNCLLLIVPPLSSLWVCASPSRNILFPLRPLLSLVYFTFLIPRLSDLLSLWYVWPYGMAAASQDKAW